MIDKWYGEWNSVMYNVYRFDNNREFGSLRFGDSDNLIVNLIMLMKSFLIIVMLRRDF